MILFKDRFIEAILTGQKTQTRRGGKKRWNVGSTHQCRTSYFSQPFAVVEIKNVRREKLGEITQKGAQAEGFETPADFLASFADINKLDDTEKLPDTEVWVIEFALAD